MRAYKLGEGEGREKEEVQKRENEKDTHGERRAGERASESENTVRLEADRLDHLTRFSQSPATLGSRLLRVRSVGDISVYLFLFFEDTDVWIRKEGGGWAHLLPCHETPPRHNPQSNIKHTHAHTLEIYLLTAGLL